VVGVVLQDRSAVLDLADSFAHALAHLLNGNLRQFYAALPHEVSHAVYNLSALLERLLGPGLISLGGVIQGGINIWVSGKIVSCYYFIIDWILCAILLHCHPHFFTGFLGTRSHCR